jgi:hypothetical protein
MLKFCENCGAPLEKPGQHFCLQCGAPVVQKGSPPPAIPAVCKACGNPLRTGEKFCSKCLVRVGDQPRNGPALTLAPPAISPAPGSSSLQKGTTSIKTIAVVGILGLIILAGAVILISEDDTGSAGSSFTDTQLPREAHDISDQPVTVQDIQQRDNVLTGIATALVKGDNQAVLAGLSAGTREKYGNGGLGLSDAESQVLADALRNAEPVKEYPQSAMYETSIDGRKLTFVMWKEEGSWKISGL